MLANTGRTTMRPTELRHDSDIAPRLRLLPEKWRRALFNVAHPLHRQQFEPHCQLRAVQAWLGKLTFQLLGMESLPFAMPALPKLKRWTPGAPL